MNQHTVEVTKDSFQEEVLGAETPVLVDFWAEWCGPCKMIAPIVDELATEHQGALKVAKLDADTNQEVLMQYGIMGIPTLILFKGGQEVERIVGYKPKEDLMAKISPHLN